MRTPAQDKWAKENRDKVLAQKKRHNSKLQAMKPPKKCKDCGKELPSRKMVRCDDCKKKVRQENFKEYAEENKDRLKKLRAEWFKKNKKRVLKQQKAYRESLR